MALSDVEPRTWGKIVVNSIVAIVIIFIALMLILDKQPIVNSQPDLSDFEQAILEKAKEIYKEKKAQGIDLTSGPCLSEDIEIDWVLDIAHSPREPVDDLTENQCQNYRQGKAKHFIELTPNGKLIKMK
jgi:hypothetical protein